MSAQLWPYLPRHERHLHPLQSHVQVVTHASDHLAIDWRFPRPTSLGLINFLEWFTELREIFYLLDYWFMIKGYNTGTARWKRCPRQGMREGQRDSMLPEFPHVHQTGSSPNPILGCFYGGFITREEYHILPCIMDRVHNVHPCFWLKPSGKKSHFNFLIHFIYLYWKIKPITIFQAIILHTDIIIAFYSYTFNA